MVELLDLFPTMASLAALPPPPASWKLPGTDLTPGMLSGKVVKPLDAAYGQITRCINCSMAYSFSSGLTACARDRTEDAAMYLTPCAETPRQQFDWMGFSVRVADWRYSLFCRWNGTTLQPNFRECAPPELYNHSRDKSLYDVDDNGEQENLAGQTRLEHQEKTLQALLMRRFPNAKTDDHAGAPPVVGPNTHGEHDEVLELHERREWVGQMTNAKTGDGNSAAPPRYSVTAERTNGQLPVIATHLHMPSPAASRIGHTAESRYFYNFNPTSLRLPDDDKTWAIILRTVANQTEPATASNPDFLTLSRVRKMGDAEGRGPIIIDPVNQSSIIFRSTPGEKYDDRGVQDPRVMRDPETGIYWLTASSIGSSYVGTVIANSRDGISWSKVSRCDADHTNPIASTRIDPIRNVSCNYGRAASILWRERGEHYMIWGAGTLNLARSINRSLTGEAPFHPRLDLCVHTPEMSAAAHRTIALNILAGA
eukprot:SAG11_NODE_833_length_6943_cov_4.544126_3_plen_482_part_00